MELCSEGHEEICYEGRNCPCCELIGEKEILENKLTDKETEVDSLKAEIEELDKE